MERIGVWWDMESCPLPTYMNPYVIMSLSTALLAKFKIQGNVHHFSAFESLPKQSNEFKQILAHSGIRLQQIPPDKSNEIEKTILVDVLFWAMDTPAPAHIIFIVGNLDFSNVFHRLRQRRYNVFLLCSSAKEISQGMLTASSACLEWQSLGLAAENGAMDPLSQRSPTIQRWPREYDPADFASAGPNTLSSGNPVPNYFGSANSIQTGWNKEELRGFENISSFNMADTSGIVDNTNAIPGIPPPYFHHHPWGIEQPNSHSSKPNSSETRSKHKEKASNKKKREPKPPKHDLPDFTPAMPNPYSSASSIPPDWNREELWGFENISGFSRAQNREAKTENPVPSFHNHIRSTDQPCSHSQNPKFSEPRPKPRENPAFGKKKQERQPPISENKKQEPKPSISEKKNQGPQTPKTPPNPKAIKNHFKAWLRQVVNSDEHKNGYNISTIYQDFKRATGKTLDLNSLGIENLSTLLLEFKDVALMTEVSKGCLVLFPVKRVKQKPLGALVSGDKPKASTDDIRNWLLQLLQKGELSQGIFISSLHQKFEGQTGKIIDLDINDGDRDIKDMI